MTWNCTTPAVGSLAACALALFAAALPAQQAKPALPASSLPLRLTGVMVDDKAPSNSSCFVRCVRSEERQGTLHVGDVACEVAEIKEIREDGLVLRNLAGDRLEFLAFPPDAGKTAARQPAPAAPVAAPPPAAAAVPALDAVAVEIPKATVERYLSNLGELLQSALAVPHYSEAASGQRMMDGFEISRIKEGGAAEQVGLQNGDVVLEVNGQPLDSMSTVMALFGRVPTLTQARMIVLRGSQRMTIVINVK
jgi:type II secretory pathway component PulC